MPRIQTIEDQLAPQGAIGVRATPDDFGAQIGEGLQRLGASAEQVNQSIYANIEAKDVTEVHTNMAKARAEWTQTLQDRERNATPGDDTFAPKLMKDMNDYFEKGAESAATPKGKRLWKDLAANMTSEFGQRAIGIQADLAGKDAANKYDLLLKSSGTTVFNDPTQTESVTKAALAAVDDPSSIFAKVPATVRDRFKQDLTQQINYAAARGFVRKNPEAFLKMMAPDQLEKFQPWESLLQNNAAPGGKADVSPAAMKFAPDVAQAGATKGVNPNVLLAQIDKESKGNPAAVSPKGAAGLAQFMPDTAKQYGVDVNDPKSSITGQAAYMGDLLKQFNGDYSKALAAYNWGPGNLTAALTRWGGDWQKHLPSETSDYVATIMAKSGLTAAPQTPLQVAQAQPQLPADSAQVTQASARKEPVAAGPDFFKALSWEEQDHVIKEAVQLQHMRVVLAEKARNDQEFALKHQQEQVMGSFLDKIIEPATYGAASEHDILADPTLAWNQKQHLIDYKTARDREVAGGAESRTNPVEVRRLMLQIHAADDDPSKSYNMDPVMASYKAGRISTPEMKMLRNEVEQMRDGNGSNFTKDVHSAKETVYSGFTRSVIGAAQPEVAIDAAYRFGRDLDAQIDALRKANKDPRTLLDPASPDYAMKPERLAKYMPTASSILEKGAGKTVEAAKLDRTPAPGYTIGSNHFIVGKNRTYLGGPINLSTSWSQ